MFDSPNSIPLRCSVMQAIQSRQPVEVLDPDGNWIPYEGLVPDFDYKKYRLPGDRIGDHVKGGSS